jgi:hypothetical protein
MESKFQLSPMIASQLSQRLEGRVGRKETEGMVTRGVALRNTENIQKYKTGPPVKKNELEKKKVAFVEPDPEVPRADKHNGLRLKSKAVPYVEIPPLRVAARVPEDDPIIEEQNTKIGPAYKSRAPVEIGLDIERIVERVLDLEISVPLRNLAGISGAVQKEIRKQVTKARIPIETNVTEQAEIIKGSRPKVRLTSLPTEMYTVSVMPELPDTTEQVLVADDPIMQYLIHNKDLKAEDLMVANSSDPLRSIYCVVNRMEQEECLVDNGSMIVSMSRKAAIELGLTWEPALRIQMESASGHLESTLGISRNVRFEVGGLDLFLQVHILENPPYKILLGRPFETFTNCITKTRNDGSSELEITDPNTKKTAVVPTYKRGCGPEDLQKQNYQDF